MRNAAQITIMTNDAKRRAVWDQLRAVAYGQTATDSQIAERPGNPRAVRAVGLA